MDNQVPNQQNDNFLKGNISEKQNPTFNIASQTISTEYKSNNLNIIRSNPLFVLLVLALILIIAGLFILGKGKNQTTTQNIPIYMTPTPSIEKKPISTSIPIPTLEPSEDIPLNASVKSNSLSVMVTNNTTTDMQDCTLSLNLSGGLFSQTSWNNHQTSIAAHNAVIVPYTEFTKADGTRFNTNTTQPQNLYASCLVNGTRQFAQWTLQK